jgi:hypothetical protein
MELFKMNTRRLSNQPSAISPILRIHKTSSCPSSANGGIFEKEANELLETVG